MSGVFGLELDMFKMMFGRGGGGGLDLDMANVVHI